MNHANMLLMAATAKKPYKRQLAYLESTGTQYIDTGTSPTADMEIEVGISGAVFGTNVNCFVYGARTGATDATNYALVNYTATSKLRFDRGTINESPSGDISPSTYAVVKRVGASNYVDGTPASTCTAAFTAPELSIYLFGVNQNNAVFHGTSDSFALYYCRIKIAGAIVRDFIPVIDWNDRPCLYDKVSRQLFHNAGTGEFYYA